jgi:predicted lipoprotein with Yx(FWY)xxD motif
MSAVLALTSGIVAASAIAQSAGTKIGLHKTSAGMILVNSKGFTLYAFTRDAKNKDACVKITNCIKAWPAVTTTGKPVAGSGVKSSLLGTIPYKGSLKQVTYAGHPLYTFAEDDGPGNTEYLDESAAGGRWPGLNAAGKEVGKDSD